MRILLASHSSGRAGAEQSLVELAGEATRQGHTVDVTLPSPGPLETALQESVRGPIFITYLKTRWWMGKRHVGMAGVIRLVQAMADTFRFVAFMRRNKPDVVVVNTAVTPAPLFAATILKIPVVLILRESLLGNVTLKSALPKKIIIFLIKRLPTLLIPNSAFVADMVGESFFIPPSIPKLDRKRRWQSQRDGNDIKFVLVGSISPEKGQLDFLEACAKLSLRGVEFTAYLAGGGSPAEVTWLRGQITRLGLEKNAHYIGETNDVSSLYEICDFSVVCSKNEAFGRVTVESLAMGTPVVGYDCGGTREILLRGGGMLVEPDSDSLADAIDGLRKNSTLLDRLKDDAGQNYFIETCDAATKILMSCISGLGFDGKEPS